ncbi:MAG: IclR family transcriptional regulator [Mesorhizobium sp.]|uniref:IclR family transcriptional regulator n=1 Tax=Mesorhizobium sp. TaxID=1871066 RepID=UPI000FE9B69F|nr:IclR family transcriptional regulator [Mesorhizobium sp.]RWD66000.1 MAG: IclR family transcriptional regulator [Mesorhizobium sp.]RWE32876.1 MAG: IclR family transcriptional regulator [Mesorhizobium sp.]
MSKTMGTVDKALILLEFFTVAEPEWGLSELAREAGHDKATTLRLLNSLTRGGFVEQHSVTKKFRLGRNILKLARVREASFPIASVVEPVLGALAAETSETAHAALGSGTGMITIGIAEPQRSTRVYVDPSQRLPFHATASGIAYLAFADDRTLDAVLADGNFKKHTSQTVRTADDLRRLLAETRAQGFAISARTFEDEVVGIAVPFFDATGQVYGTISVASVASRLTSEGERSIAAAVRKAANEVTTTIGGEVPDEIRDGEEAAA